MYAPELFDPNLPLFDNSMSEVLIFIDQIASVREVEVNEKPAVMISDRHDNEYLVDHIFTDIVEKIAAANTIPIGLN